MAMHSFPSFRPNRIPHGSLFLAVALLVCAPWPAWAAMENLLAGAEVKASSHRENATPQNAVDGVVADTSRWLAADGDAAPWIEFRWADPKQIVVVDVFSGWKDQDAIGNFSLSVWDGGKRIHSQTLEQVAFVLWLQPELEQWIPREFFNRCRALLFEHWEASGALGIPEWWPMESYMEKAEPTFGKLHPFKGRHAPGHSIIPNLTNFPVFGAAGETPNTVSLKP